MVESTPMFAAGHGSTDASLTSSSRKPRGSSNAGPSSVKGFPINVWELRDDEIYFFLSPRARDVLWPTAEVAVSGKIFICPSRETALQEFGWIHTVKTTKQKTI